MGILFAGNEWEDFPIGSVRLQYPWVADPYRSSYVRTALGADPRTLPVGPMSEPFSGGGVTTAWLTARIWRDYSTPTTSRKLMGLCKSTEPHSSGIWVTHGASNAKKIRLIKTDGTTDTQLGESASEIWPNSDMLKKVDLEVKNYGASATVNVYIDAAETPVITYNGDITVGSMADMDCVGITGKWDTSYNEHQVLSEVIACTSNTKSFSLATLIPNSAGDANAWTGAYTEIDNLYPGHNYLYTNGVGQAAQFGLSDLPAGDFYIWGVKICAYACAPNGSTADKIKIGVKSGGTIDLDSGHSLGENFAWIQRWAETINGETLTPTLANAMQIAFESAS